MRLRSLLSYLSVLSLCLVYFGTLEAVQAQSSLHAKTLLWRVHKPEQAHNSYLYGTMHARDERAYEFADSVLPALSGCHYFALEQRIDTLFASMMTQALDTSSGIRLKDIVQGPQLDSLCRILSELSSIPESKIPNLRCGFLSQLLETETHSAKNDRPTVLDAYLLGLARSLRKELMAMEGSADNMLLLDKVGAVTIRAALESSASEPASVVQDGEEVFTVYFDQNIDSLAALLNASLTSHSGLADTLLQQRNIVMAMSFDSLHHIASLFAAVGAAHLGGAGGIIELLRAKGYSVEAVMPTYTGVRHQFDNIDLSANEKWYDYRSENNGFSIRTPAQLVDSPFNKEFLPLGNIDAPLCIDVISGLRFQVVAQTNDGGVADDDRKLLADQVAEKLYSNPVEKQRRTDAPYLQSYLGHPCYDYFGSTSSDEIIRLRIVCTKRSTYTLMVYGSKDNINNSSVNGFLNSLEFQELKKQEWSIVRDSVHAIECEMIGRVQVRRNLEIESTPVRHFSKDVSTGNAFLYRSTFVSDIRKGSSLEDILKEQVYSRGDERGILDFRLESCPEADVCASYTTEADSLGQQIRGRMFLRRRHFYQFEFRSLNLDNYADDCSRFFRSIRFLPRRDSTVWREYYDDTTRMTISFPAAPVKRVYDAPEGSIYDRILSWEAANDTASQRCGICRYTLSPYACVQSLDSLVRSIVSLLKVEGDTVTPFQRNDIDNTTLVDFTIQKKQCELATRYRAIIRGNMVYLAFAYLHEANKKSVDVDNFFRSIVLAPSTDFNISAPKFQLWYNDLRAAQGNHADSLRRMASWISAAASDVSFLRTQLLHPLINEDADYAKAGCGEGADGPLRSVLFDKLLSYEDSLSTEFFVKLFKSNQRLPEFQCEILSAMAWTDKTEIQAAFFQLLRSDAQRLRVVRQADYKVMFEPVRTHPERIVRNLTALVDLYHVPVLRGTIVSIVHELLGKKLIDSTAVHWSEIELARELSAATKRFQASMSKHAKGGIVKDKASNDDLESSELAMNICKWFEARAFGTTTANVLREAMRVFANEYLPLSQQAAIDLLLNGNAVPDSVLLRIVSDKFLSIRVIGIVDSLKLKTAIPPEYFSQEHVAKCLISYVVAEEEETDVDSVLILSEHILPRDSISQRYFLLRYHVEALSGSEPESSARWYVALVGSFDTARTSLFLREQETYYRYRSFHTQSVEQHLQDCVQTREEAYRRRAKERMRSQ